MSGQTDGAAVTPGTRVEIRDDAFHIGGRPTYPGREHEGRRVEGLLFNSRMVQATFDDRNPDTQGNWAYPDTGVWDPDRNTRELVAAMPSWRAHGLLGITVNLQGGNPWREPGSPERGYRGEQRWDNSAIRPDGSLREDYLTRLGWVLDEADRLGMAVILGLFYFGQDHRVHDELAVRAAVDAVVGWLADRDQHHVLLEIANESDVPAYSHDILRPMRVHELIEHVQRITHGRLPVSTSFGGGTVPPEHVAGSADFILLHGNGVDDPDDLAAMVHATRELRSFTPKPIVFNEDNHFDFDRPHNHLRAALGAYASWGYFDPGENNYRDGFQSPPVRWEINTPLKQAFFRTVAAITAEAGAQADS